MIGVIQWRMLKIYISIGVWFITSDMSTNVYYNYKQSHYHQLWFITLISSPTYNGYLSEKLQPNIEVDEKLNSLETSMNRPISMNSDQMRILIKFFTSKPLLGHRTLPFPFSSFPLNTFAKLSAYRCLFHFQLEQKFLQQNENAAQMSCRIFLSSS